MGKTIEIRLSDAQHAALWKEAEASGKHLFDYARMKLCGDLERRAEPVPIQTIEPKKVPQAVKPSAPPAAEDRISRIEDALTRLTEFVLNGQAAAPQPQAPNEPIDVDSLVDAQFREAEALGLTEHVPDEAEQQLAASGVRPLSRRPVPFSAGNAPRHLQQMLG